MTEEDIEVRPRLAWTTERQRKFFEIWAEKYNFSTDKSVIAKAYVEAGYSPNWAEYNARRTLLSSNLNKIVRLNLEKKNITIERLSGKLSDLLDAEHPFVKGAPDSAIQLKAFQEAMKIYGGYPVPVQKVDVSHTEEYHISVEDQRKANEVARVIDVEPVEDGNDEPGEAILRAEESLY